MDVVLDVAFTILAVVIVGLSLFYVIAAIPAAVVAGLKRNWVMFGVGFISFGIAWYVGALAVARPNSWWGRRFGAAASDVYPEGSGTGGLRRSDGRLALGIAGAVLTIGLLAVFPTPFLGTDGRSLQNSVDGLFSFKERCQPRGDSTWTCYKYDNASSGDLPYRVSVNWAGCWEGKAEAGSRPPAPSEREISGCVWVFDHVRLVDRIVD